MWPMMGDGNASWPPAVGYSVIGFMAAAAAYDLSRHAWPGVWRRRVRPVDHGVKLTGAYFAMMSAGAGNLLREFQPWSQFLPTTIGVLVAVALAVSHVRHTSRRTARRSVLPADAAATHA